MLRKIKEGILRRTEKNAVSSEIEGETVILKHSRLPFIGDWSRVYPLVNQPKEGGEPTWNWANIWIGGKKNFFKLLFIMIIVALVFYYVTSVIGDAKQYMDGSKFVIMNKTIFYQYCKIDTPIVNSSIPVINYTGG